MIRRLAVVVVLVAATPLLADLGALSPVGAFTVATAACFVAMALSLDVLVGHAGQLSLGHGGLLAIGAVTSALVTGRWYLPFAAGVAAAVVVTAAVGAAVAVPAIRLRTTSLALVTLAVGIAAEQSLFRWQWLTHGSAGLTLPRPEIGAFVFTDSADFAAIAVVVAAALWFVEGRLDSSSFGRALHLVRHDERAAAAFGVDVRVAKIAAFALAGGMAGAAGATYAHLLVVTTADTFSYAAVSLPLLGIVVVGGPGNRVAVSLAAAAYALVPRLLTPLESWQPVIGGALFLATLLRNPAGLAGVLGRVRRGRGWTSAAADALPPPRVSARLDVQSLTVHRGDLEVVRDVDLVVEPGRLVAIVGPNGSGKSTLLDAIAGFLPATSGRVLLDGVDLTRSTPHARRRAGIARTFQDRGVPGALSVRELLLAAQDADAPAGDDAVARAHARVAGIEDRASAPVAELSVGQRRMLERRCAIAGRPSVLLLDEPAAGLSPTAVDALVDELHTLRAAGLAILLVEHRRDVIDRVADVVHDLGAGRSR